MNSEQELKELRALLNDLRSQLAAGSERFAAVTHQGASHQDALFNVETGAIAKIAVIREKLNSLSRNVESINARLRRIEIAYWRGVGALVVVQSVAVVLVKLL